MKIDELVGFSSVLIYESRRKYISATAEIVLNDEDKCVIIYYCDER